MKNERTHGENEKNTQRKPTTLKRAPVKQNGTKRERRGEKLPEEDSMQVPVDNIVQPQQACLSACMN